MTSLHASRRAVIGALSTMPLAMCAKPAPAAMRSEFGAKLRLMETARSEALRHNAEIYDPAHTEYLRRIENIPHTTAIWLGQEKPVEMTTANKAMVRIARDVISRTGRDKSTDNYLAACRIIADGADKREAEIEAIAAELGLSDKASQNDMIWDAFSGALDDVISCPVANLGELAQKLAIVTAEEQWEMEHAQEAIAADVNRLGGAA